MLELENNVNAQIDNLESLLKHNETYYQLFLSRPFFKMINNDSLNQSEKMRKTFFNYMQIFSDYFQTMMQIRQANCLDPKFSRTFLTHFLDELGHDDLLRKQENSPRAWDPILVAVSTWFVHQMQVLDNIEKAVVMHLVLEKGGDYYHSLGNKKLSVHAESTYYEIHAEHDENHTVMVLDLLGGYPPFIYQRLNQLLKESWSMLYTMVDRIYELTMKEA